MSGARSVVLIVALATSGCSLMFMKPVQANGASGCTSSDAMPTVDTIIAVAEAARTGYALTLSDAAYRGQALSRPADIAIGATFVLTTVVSASYGYHEAAECQRQRADERAERRATSRRRLRPRDLTPPSMPPPYEPPGTGNPPAAADGGGLFSPDGGAVPDAEPAAAAPEVVPARPAPPAMPARPAPPAVPQRTDDE